MEKTMKKRPKREFSLRHKQLLWYYFQVLRSLGEQAKYTSRTYIYERAAREAGYEQPETAASLIRAMCQDAELYRRIEHTGSKGDIE